jgi:hypothetical protein
LDFRSAGGTSPADQHSDGRWDLLSPQDWDAVGRFAGGVSKTADRAASDRDTTDLAEASEPADGRLAFQALVAFTVVLVLAPQEFFPILGQLRLAFVAAIVALAAHILGRSSDAPALPKPAEFKITLVLLAWAALCISTSYWPGGSVAALTDQYLKTLVIFWLLGQVVCSVRRLRVLLWTIAVITIPISVTGVKNYLSGAFVLNRVAGYAGGLTANPNDLALTLNLFIPLTVALALTATRGWQRMLAWGIVGVSAATVLVTFSRGGFLTLIAEAGLMLPLLLRRGAAKTIGSIAVCAVLALVMLPSGFGDRMSTIIDIDADTTGSGQERRRDTIAATEYLFDHPIIGAGLNMGILAMNQARGARWVMVHNTYLNYGVDLGMPGLVLFVALHATSLLSARRAERMAIEVVGSEFRTLASGVRVSLGGFVVAAFFYPVPYHFYFYYIAGLSVAVKTIAARQFGLPKHV